MSKIIKMIKKIKIRNLIILIFLLIFNSYAWFIFSTKASVGLTAHVSAWKVNFMENGMETTDIIINVDRIFPGMMPFEKEIEVENLGEVDATLEYQIESLRIMEQEFIIGQDLTLQELEEKIQKEYPFKINVLIEDFGTIQTNPTVGKYKIQVEWPFDSGNDELDTFWGNKASDYYQLNEGNNSIEIKIKLIAKQKNGA